MDVPKVIVGVVRGKGQRAQISSIRDWCRAGGLPSPEILVNPDDALILKRVKHRSLLVLADTKVLGEGLGRPLSVVDALEKKRSHVIGVRDGVDTRLSLGWFGFIQKLIHAQYQLDLAADKAGTYRT